MAMSNHNHDDVQINIEPEQLTAYALGQLEGEELAAVKTKLASGDGAAEREIAAVRALCGVVSDVRAAEPTPTRRLATTWGRVPYEWIDEASR